MINVAAQGLGNIIEADVVKADSMKAMLLGFRVQLTTAAKELAVEKNLKTETFSVIYDLVDLVKQEVDKLTSPLIIEEITGKIKVVTIFRQEKNKFIVGGKVLSGKIENKSKFKVWRGEEFLTVGLLKTLQADKQNVNEVVEGQECGLELEVKEKIETGDLLEFYHEIKKKK